MTFRKSYIKRIVALITMIALFLVLVPFYSVFGLAEDYDRCIVTVDYNGGTDNDDEVVKYGVNKGDEFYLPTWFSTSPEPDQALAGWCYDKACSGEVLTESVIVDTDTTFYAKWVDGWTVDVDMTDGAIYNQTCEVKNTVARGEEISLYVPALETNPLPDGRFFCGFYTGPNATGDLIYKEKSTEPHEDTFGDKAWIIPSLEFTPTENTTLYAYWSNPIDITFDQNGYNIWFFPFASYDYSNNEDGSLTMSGLSGIPSKDFPGIYTSNNFIGWSTNPNATEPDDIDYVRESTTLYAVYEKSEDDEPVATPELVSKEGNYLKAKTYSVLELQNAPGDEYEYKFIVYNTTSKQWYKLQDFSDLTTYNWYTGPAGVKNLYVDIRNKSDHDDITRIALANVNVTEKGLGVTNFTSSEGNEVAEKTNTTLAAEGIGGTSPYEYKFIVHNEDNGQWYKIQDFSSKNTCDWYTGPAGNKTLYVDVRDAEGTVVRKGLTVKVNK